MTSGTYRVGVWGHYYGANLGDDLVTSVVIEAIRRRRADAAIRGFSMDAADTARRHGVPASAIVVRHASESPGSGPAARGLRRIVRGLRRRATKAARELPHIWQSYRALREVDHLVVAGSGQLLDSWGLWGHPYTLFKWSCLARAARTDLAFLSVGAGPIDGRVARFFVRSAVNAASYVSVRDASSAAVLRAIGVIREMPVRPDMAFGLDAEPLGSREEAGDGRTVVGLNAMPHASSRYWPSGDDGRYRAYIRKLATIARGLIDEGARVVLFSSQVVSDPPAAADVAEETESLYRSSGGSVPRGHLTEAQVASESDLLDTIARCDMVIASRFHCVVLPLLLEIPTIGLAYHAKTVEVMTDLGQAEYCVNIDHFDPQDVLHGAGELRRNDDAIRAHLRRRLPALRAEVEQQFDTLFGTRSDVDVDRDQVASRGVAASRR